MAETASRANAGTEPAPPWVGRSIRARRGRGAADRARPLHRRSRRPPGTLHAAILRSPHAHADIVAIDSAAATARPASSPCITGADVKALTASLVVGVKAPIECWPIAVERVRYVGEPVAVVVATDRYLAEDALDLIEVALRSRCRRWSIRWPRSTPDAPVLHDGLGAQRRQRPHASATAIRKRAFADGRASRQPSTSAIRAIPARRSRPTASSPNTMPARTPTTCSPTSRARSASMPVLARALKVPGNRLRLRTPPDSGGSFGVKQGVFPYIVLIARRPRASPGRPVKWIEDRLEHLTASVSATNRVTTLEAPRSTADGRITRARLGPGRGLRRASARARSRPRSIACTAI